VLALEGGVRLWRSSTAPAHFPAEFLAGRAFVEGDEVLGFRLVPGYGDGFYRVNADGFRGDPLPGDLGERFIILCAGDSTTFGWEVPQGGDFPAQLAGHLAARAGSISVINGGVPSFTSEQILRKLRRDLPRIRPEIVVVTMPWNDLWYSAITPWQPSVLVPSVPAPWQSWLRRRSALFRAVVHPPNADLRRNRSAAEALRVFGENIGATIDLVRGAGAIAVLQMPPFSPGHVAPAGVRFRATGLQWDKAFLVRTAQRYADAFRDAATARDGLLVENRLFMAAPGRMQFFLDELHPTADGNGKIAKDLLDALDGGGVLPGPGSS
jgi:lysophospholipase L1-like esterase